MALSDYDIDVRVRDYSVTVFCRCENPQCESRGGSDRAAELESDLPYMSRPNDDDTYAAAHSCCTLCGTRHEDYLGHFCKKCGAKKDTLPF